MTNPISGKTVTANSRADSSPKMQTSFTPVETRSAQNALGCIAALGHKAARLNSHSFEKASTSTRQESALGREFCVTCSDHCIRQADSELASQMIVTKSWPPEAGRHLVWSFCYLAEGNHRMPLA